MTALIIVDRLAGLDRFCVPPEETAYRRYGKTHIEIPEQLQQHLLTILRTNIRSNMTVLEEIEWVSTAIYCSFHKIKRKLVELGVLDSENGWKDSNLYYLLYTQVDELINQLDFTSLYKQINTTEYVSWVKVCDYIQTRLMDAIIPKISHQIITEG